MLKPDEAVGAKALQNVRRGDEPVAATFMDRFLLPRRKANDEIDKTPTETRSQSQHSSSRAGGNGFTKDPKHILTDSDDE